jgi:FeS assembly protein IscX
MISPVELRRIMAEWRLRMQRVKDILQPPTWNEKEWRQFSQALALMVRNHGQSWIIDPNVYWDLRWHLQDGAELVCQVEHIPGEKTSLVVAQNGGFAAEVGSYTWLWAEFNMDGNFSRDPYWVEGTWKEALTALLLPLDRQASYLLAGRADTPDALLLQEGARPNDQNYLALMPGLSETNDRFTAGYEPRENSIIEVDTPAKPEPQEIKPAEILAEASAPAAPEIEDQRPVEIISEPVTSTPLIPEGLEEKPAEIVSGSTAVPEIKKDEPPVEPSPRIDTPAPFAIRWGMPQKLTWKDTDEIAYELIDKYPDQDPLKLSFPKLHKLITELEEFGDDPTKSSESILETIQMTWYEEVK